MNRHSAPFVSSHTTGCSISPTLGTALKRCRFIIWIYIVQQQLIYICNAKFMQCTYMHVGWALINITGFLKPKMDKKLLFPPERYP